MLSLGQAGCGDPAPSSGTASLAEAEAAPSVTWTVSPDPVLEIGVLEGGAPYQLHRVTSVARLPDGGVAVVNAGSGEVRIFDAGGRFVTSSGRKGEGPGEWRGPDRIRLLGADTLLILDARLRREGRMRVDGLYLGSEPMRDDVLFPADQWLYGRFLVDSPLRPAERGALVPALDRMGAASGSVSLARVTGGGRIWTTGWSEGDGPREWRVHDLEGRPLARVITPAGFEVHDQGEDWVLGVARDSLDVEYVELRRLDRGGDRYDDGALARASEVSTRPPPVFRPASSGAFPDMVSAMKNLATAQEMHYARRMTYTVELDTLAAGLRPRFELPDGVAFEPLRAGPDGWAARLVQNGGREGCLLSYGRFRIMGVIAGAVICWEDHGVGAVSTN